MARFEQFIKERQYLINVSERTIEWYRQALRWLPNENPTDSDLKQVVVRMRDGGLKARSVNSYRTAVNAYMHWSSVAEGACSPSCSHPKISRLREPSTVLPTFAPNDIKKFVAHKPKSFGQRRLQVLVLTLADTGCRISELLELKWSDVNFADLLVTVRGKGDKQRIIPFSLELRKHLYRLQKVSEFQLVFPARTGTQLGRRNVLRDVKVLCGKLGVKVPARALHAFRHSFSVNYLRRGGSVFHLQKCLGHTTLDMTRRYANLLTEDLQKMHQQVSLLA